jgi:hypothetical protein
VLAIDQHVDRARTVGDGVADGYADAARAVVEAHDRGDASAEG